MTMAAWTEFVKFAIWPLLFMCLLGLFTLLSVGFWVLINRMNANTLSAQREMAADFFGVIDKYHLLGKEMVDSVNEVGRQMQNLSRSWRLEQHEKNREHD